MKVTATVEQAERLGLPVIYWRFEQLELAGYDTETAIMLSAQGDIDLHEACDLVRLGATVQQALRILL